MPAAMPEPDTQARGIGATPAAADDKPVVELSAADLHSPGAVFCPNPKMPLWSSHPRVFLDIGTTGRTMCPYCGTRYVLKDGAPGRGH